MSYREDFVGRVIQYVKENYDLELTQKDGNSILYEDNGIFIAQTRSFRKGEDFEEDVYHLVRWILDIYKKRTEFKNK